MVPRSVLVIDDDEDILLGIEYALTDAGHTVTTSLRAKYIEELIHSAKPDIIIMDVLLSGADGREICRGLKANEKYKHIPVLLISAQSHMDVEAKKAGANAFLAKPFDLDHLLQKVDDLTST